MQENEYLVNPVFAEINLAKIISNEFKKSRIISNKHPITRDFSFIFAKTVSAAILKKAIDEVLASSTEMQYLNKCEMKIFDVYSDTKIGDEFRSISFRLNMSFLENVETKTIKNIETIIINELTTKFNGKLRN